MKKTWGAVLSTLALVLALSYGITYIWPLFSPNPPRTYSETNCLTEQVTAEMEDYEIAKLYRDGNATVAVFADGGHGSGVCIASKGYETSITVGESNLVANKGSYIVTNHHVIDNGSSGSQVGTTVQIMTESEDKYSAKVIWENMNLDLAVLYSDECNLNYVTMKDIVIDPAPGEKFDYQPIFAIGCPLDVTDYLNRFTAGYIGTNDTFDAYTLEDVNGAVLLSNVYQDLLDTSAGISAGNSGGGCFDENGYLIGLNTLSTPVEDSGGNQLTGVVPIYPIMQIIDRLIENNEAEGENVIYSLLTLGIYGVDAQEAALAKQKPITHNNISSYYVNRQYYSAAAYKDGFKWKEDGYYILKNTSTSITGIGQITGSSKIKKCVDAEGKIHVIENRNDFIYFLLGVEKGDTVTISYINSYGMTSVANITF